MSQASARVKTPVRTRAACVLFLLIAAALAFLLPLPPDAPLYAAGDGSTTPAPTAHGAVNSIGYVSTTPGMASLAYNVSASCAPLSVDPDPRHYLVSRIYYVNHAPAVNVRRGPGLGYCIIATQSYTANVVAVPNAATVTHDGYRWREVAFYRGLSRSADNYSWSAVGWIVDSYLTPATHAMQCVEASCDIFEGTNAGWGILGAFPNDWDDYGCAYACRYGPVWPASACYRYGSPPTNDTCSTLSAHSGFGIPSATPGQGAATVDPNWFVIYNRPPSCSGCTRVYLFWNYSFWAL